MKKYERLIVIAVLLSISISSEIVVRWADSVDQRANFQLQRGGICHEPDMLAENH